MDPRCEKCGEEYNGGENGQTRCRDCAPWQYEDQPAWIREHLSGADIAAIQQGGCESGAYMPAVTYWQALETMNEHGDDVLDYLDENGMREAVPDGMGWSALACMWLSTAVGMWCAQFDSPDWNDDWHPAQRPKHSRWISASMF